MINKDIAAFGTIWRFFCNFYSGPEPYLYRTGQAFFLGRQNARAGKIYIRKESGLDSDDRLVVDEEWKPDDQPRYV